MLLVSGSACARASASVTGGVNPRRQRAARNRSAHHREQGHRGHRGDDQRHRHQCQPSRPIVPTSAISSSLGAVLPRSLTEHGIERPAPVVLAKTTGAGTSPSQTPAGGCLLPVPDRPWSVLSSDHRYASVGPSGGRRSNQSGRLDELLENPRRRGEPRAARPHEPPRQRCSAVRSSWARRSGSARKSSSTILPSRTVTAASEKGRPSRVVTAPTAPLISAGWMTRSSRE